MYVVIASSMLQFVKRTYVLTLPFATAIYACCLDAVSITKANQPT